MKSLLDSKLNIDNILIDPKRSILSNSELSPCFNEFENLEEDDLNTATTAKG